MNGYFGIGIYHPKTEENIGTLWRSSFVFGASFIFTIGRRYKKQSSDTTVTYRQIPLLHFIDFTDFKNHIPYGAQLVCVELNERAKPLIQSYHPKTAIYLLGAEDHGIPDNVLEGNQIMQIESLRPYCLNVAVAGSLVM